MMLRVLALFLLAAGMHAELPEEREAVLQDMARHGLKPLTVTNGVPIFQANTDHGRRLKVGEEDARTWIVMVQSHDAANHIQKWKLSATFQGQIIADGKPEEGGLPFLVLRCTLVQLQSELLHHNSTVFVEMDSPVYGAGWQSPAPSWGLSRISVRDRRPVSKDFVYPDRAGAGVTVFVVDSGIRITHEEFRGRVTGVIDVTRGALEVCRFWDRNCGNDLHGHGTHVAGTIVGSKYGVAKKANVFAMKVLVPANGRTIGTTNWFAQAVNWIAMYARRPAVVSMSIFGGEYSHTLQSAINAVVGNGITVLVCAGNSDDGQVRDACRVYPAGMRNVLTVANVDQNDIRARTSMAGPCVDIFAPGENILSAGISNDRQAVYMSGTSMATPHVSGAAALLLGQAPWMLPGAVHQWLLGQATGNVVGDTKGSPNRLLYVGFFLALRSGITPRVSPRTSSVLASTSRVVAANLSVCRPGVMWAVLDGPCTISADGCATSPNYPRPYPTKQVCTIQVCPGMTSIAVADFGTEDGHDILTVNGQQYSGRSGPHGVVPSGLISWTSDESFSDLGWRLCSAASLPTTTPPAQCVAGETWYLVAGNCNISGACVTSSNYPNQYEDDAWCTLQTCPGVGPVTATDFDVEEGYDRLILNGMTYTGRQGPDTVVPNGKIVWISDESNSGRGWRLCRATLAATTNTFTTTPAALDCTPRGTLWSVAAGNCVFDGVCITSPNYPEPYNTSSSCLILTCPALGAISAVDFNTQEFADVLAIGDERYSGSIGPQGVTPSGRSILWTSDDSEVSSGWRLCPSNTLLPPAVPPCLSSGPAWRVLEGSCTIDADGCASSPGHPSNYAPRTSCIIATCPHLGQISSTFFETEPTYDRLVINGIAYSGLLGPMDVAPTGLITWTSDFSNEASGWRICRGRFANTRVRSLPSECRNGGPLVVTEGNCSVTDRCVSSPNYPGPYPMGSTCRIVACPGSGPLTATDFWTEARYDSLSVPDDSLQFSGMLGPANVKVNGPIIWSSDGSVSERGFRLCAQGCEATGKPWTVISGNCSIGPDGCLRSPQWPETYTANSACTIMTCPGLGLLDASDFDLQDGDFLSVDGVPYQGTHGPKKVLTNKTIYWSSDGLLEGRGWRLCRLPKIGVCRGQSLTIDGENYSTTVCDSTSDSKQDSTSNSKHGTSSLHPFLLMTAVFFLFVSLTSDTK